MNLVARVKNILLTPQTEWPAIAGESGDTAYLFRNYVAILAAIPAVCVAIGLMLLPFGPMYWLALTGIVYSIIGYLMAFVGTWVLALVINLLAPMFGGRGDFAGAMKLSVYSQTPYWLAGVFYVVPALSILALLGLYGFYLLWLGLPVMMKSPKEKSLFYTIAIVACAIVLFVILGAITTAAVVAVIGMPRIR
jgi:hypothetical protein